MLIGDKYKIESDSPNLNIVLYQRTKTSYRPIAYFANPHNALEYMALHKLMDETHLKDLKEVCRKLDEIYELIKSLDGLPELKPNAPKAEKDVVAPALKPRRDALRRKNRGVK